MRALPAWTTCLLGLPLLAGQGVSAQTGAVVDRLPAGALAVAQDLDPPPSDLPRAPPPWLDAHRGAVEAGAAALGLLVVAGLGVVLLRRPSARVAGTGAGEAPRRVPADAARPGPAVLVGRSGQFAGQRLPIPPRGLTLGREPGGDGRLSFAPTSDVSRRHCAITYDVATRRFKLTDLGSSNGTFLLPDGRRLVAHQEMLCRAGQAIRLGRDNVFELGTT